MLEVLSGRGICNVVAVVVRYFGGTLLGTGGLVRAYTKSVQAGLDAAVLVEKKLACYMQLQCDYSFYGKVQYIAESIGVQIADTQFTDAVTILFLVPEGKGDQLRKKLTEASGGSARLEEGERVYYGLVNKELIVFDK
jgi:putative IMPACT (imprinted ancient) family translation regulator